MNELNPTRSMPALALRGLTIFPNMLLHFDVGRASSIQALDESMASGTPIFLVAQRDLAVEDPKQGDLFTIGTICTVRQILRLPGDNVRVMVEGVSRGHLAGLTVTTPYLIAEVEEIGAGEPLKTSPRTEALIRRTYDLFETYTDLTPKMTPDVLLSVLASEDPGYIADYIAQNIVMRSGDKQSILEELRPVRRLELLYRLLRREVEILELEHNLQNKVHEGLSGSQRDYFLREQLKVIQNELGENPDSDSEPEEYRKKIHAAKLPEEAEEKLLKEVGRLEKQPFGSAESGVLRNYLDTCLELPWNKRTHERIDVAAARKILDADHFGLEKVKERILEFLAVKQLAPNLKGQVLCLVGPPGVGKTSVAMSMARAMNRKLARISLGGIHDEAEIRGHRKTYVGAMPGRVIAAIRQAGSSNPLLLLDEIDKLAGDQRGDPASALLEVLDGEQNSTFRDHFLELPYDLSDVLFVTTANSVDTIPRPLLDRMEVIELTSYTDEEKLQIARRHLLPKEQKRHGLKKTQLKISDDAIREIIT
ncbi:MAG: LON peptidase substrate-binding domain-containing protein, partial [Pseudoflavonifractor sp.]